MLSKCYQNVIKTLSKRYQDVITETHRASGWDNKSSTYLQPTVSRVYNSPAALYSEENLAAALQEIGLQDDVTNHDDLDSTKLIPVAVTGNPVANRGNRTQKVKKNS